MKHILEYLLSKSSKDISSPAFDAFKDKLDDEALIDSFEKMPAEYTQVIDITYSKDYYLNVTVSNVPKEKCMCIMFYMYSLGDPDAVDELMVFYNDTGDVKDCIEFCYNGMNFDDIDDLALRIDAEDKSKVEEFKKKIYFVLR